MARTITMAPQAKHAPAKPAPGRATAPCKPHSPAARRGGPGVRLALAAIALAATGAGLWGTLGGAPAVDTSAQLLAEMQAAAGGSAPATHVFGGALSVTRAQGRVNVVAEAVPSRACVQVGWRLAREGTIIVNGILAPRLSAAKLSELCSGDAATLLWAPEE